MNKKYLIIELLAGFGTVQTHAVLRQEDKRDMDWTLESLTQERKQVQEKLNTVKKKRLAPLENQQWHRRNLKALVLERYEHALQEQDRLGDRFEKVLKNQDRDVRYRVAKMDYEAQKPIREMSRVFDDLLAMLEFTPDTESEKEKMKKCVDHNVVRVNVLTLYRQELWNQRALKWNIPLPWELDKAQKRLQEVQKKLQDCMNNMGSVYRDLNNAMTHLDEAEDRLAEVNIGLLDVLFALKKWQVKEIKCADCADFSNPAETVFISLPQEEWRKQKKQEQEIKLDDLRKKKSEQKMNDLKEKQSQD